MPPMATTAGRRLQRGAERELRDGRRKMQRNLRSQEWRNATAVIAAVIAGYFVTSVGLTFFQKSLISVRHSSKWGSGCLGLLPSAAG